MRRDDVIRMAQQWGDWNGQTVEFNDVGLERFAALVAAAEREAILQISADNWFKTQTEYDAAIRARGNT